ncbi:hypothetical protein HMPREF2692_06940 [Corynebacterium sp. HMSC036D03]|uniref:hypothetical protein n=1 Tax=Corynebacterium TaxID=1716 RepID=UPI0008AA4C76|nr:hypothetical protein [Corynebacterium sp. HMSC036D03]OHO67091.1 hypothetical protein HMPREF2692_06940 [Corynebacterium sp. HMSC036D03]
MNNTLLNFEALELTLAELAWEQQTGENPHVSLWVPSPTAKLEPTVNRDEAGIFLPSNPEAPDFQRIAQRALAALIELSAANVLEELATSQLRLERALDKFVVSTDGPTVRNGVIGWRVGANLVTGLSEVLSSGARAAHQNLRWYSGASNVIANNYLDSCFMGQTEVGSYIVKAFIPAQASVAVSNSKKAKKQSQISTREVSEIVLASVQATKEVLEEFSEHHNPEAFEWAATQGVSVEMLSGVKNLVNAEETELSVEFMRLGAEKAKSSPRQSSVVFEPTLREALEVGVSTLKKQPRPTELRVTGEVIGLMREWDEPNSRRIKMRGKGPKGKLRVYTVHLNEADYDRAMKAHQQQLLFEVKGLAEKGRFVKVQGARVTNASVSEDKENRRRRKTGEAPGQLELLDFRHQ